MKGDGLISSRQTTFQSVVVFISVSSRVNIYFRVTSKTN